MVDNDKFPFDNSRVFKNINYCNTRELACNYTMIDRKALIYKLPYFFLKVDLKRWINAVSYCHTGLENEKY